MKKALDKFRKAVHRVVSEAQEALPGQAWFSQKLGSLMRGVEPISSGGVTAVKEAIQQRLDQVRQDAVTLESLLGEIEELEQMRRKLERFGKTWWQEIRQALSDLFAKDAHLGLEAWLKDYAEALIAGELEACQKLAQEPFPFPATHVGLQKVFQAGTQALLESRNEEALEMLRALTREARDASGKSLLTPEQQALLEILVGRILGSANYPDQAREHFEHARQLAPEAGPPYAALAHYYLAQGDPEEAVDLAQRAIETSPELPEGYVALGMWAEGQERWEEAQEFYDQAVAKVLEEKDPYLALSRLLAPLSGGLCLSLARRLFEAEYFKAAKRAINEALDLGVKGPGGYPEAPAYELKGKILKNLKEPDSAVAMAYYEASCQYSKGNQYENAIALFKLAAHHNPKHQPTYWWWSDTLRQFSYPPGSTKVDEKLLQESLRVWEQGFELGPPDPDNSWAYVARAIISDYQAQIPRSHRWTLWWESIAYLEQAILSYQPELFRWAYLGRSYRYLYLQSSALKATEQALKLGPENSVALEEYAAILADVGRFNEAEKIIDKRRELAPSTWADSVKAFICLYSRRYQEALDLLNPLIEAVPDDLFSRDLRGQCHLQMGQTSEALADFQSIWNRFEKRYDPTDPNSPFTFGWAAYNLRKLDEAIQIFQTFLNDFPWRPGEAYRCLALCYLARGDLGQAMRYLDEGIARAINVNELNFLLHFGLEPLARNTAGLPHGRAVLEVLPEFKNKINARKRQLGRKPLSAEDELEQVETLLKNQADQTGLPWIGVQAGLARLSGEKGRWREAAAGYQLLQPHWPEFPEFRQGLAGACVGLQDEGDRLLKAGESVQALEKYQDLRSWLEPLGDDLARANLEGREGYTRFALDDLTQAREHFLEALKLYRKGSIFNPGRALAAVCRRLLTDALRYWALDGEWQTLGADPKWEDLHTALQAARQELAGYLADLFQLSAQSGAAAGKFAVVIPIIVQIGAGLDPAEDLVVEEWPPIKTYLPQMRTRIFEEMGVRLPGVNIRGHRELDFDYYRILLEEIPLLTDRVLLDHGYSPSPPEALEALGIPKEVLTITIDPRTGNPGCWLPREHLKVVKRHRLELWTDPMEYVVCHLEAVLHRNLVIFLGFQEVANLLDLWRENKDGTSLINTVLPDLPSRLRFARVLRELVQDRVPITRWQDILEAVQEVGLENTETSEVVRAVRLRLKAWLPINDPSASRLKLPPELEEILTRGVWCQDGKTFFAIPPKEAKELLDKVRLLVDPVTRNRVIVVGRAELRPFLQRLADFEFPGLMVASEEELLPPPEPGEVVSRGEGNQKGH